MTPRFLTRYKPVIIYGSAMALLLFLLKWLEWRFIVLDHAFELYSSAIAIVFTGLGIWLALKLARPKVKTIVVEEEVYVNPRPPLGAVNEIDHPAQDQYPGSWKSSS